MTEWTDADLAIMQSLDAAGAPVQEIARRLGRTPEAIEEELPVVRNRKGTLPIAARPDREDEQQWYGPDEEGDVQPADNLGDPSAWVHVDPPASTKSTAGRDEPDRAFARYRSTRPGLQYVVEAGGHVHHALENGVAIARGVVQPDAPDVVA